MKFSLKIMFFLSVLFVIHLKAFAIETVVDSNDYVSISVYEDKTLFPDQDIVEKSFSEQKNKLEHQKIKPVDVVENVDSEFERGKVKEYKLSNKQMLSPFFIVGKDEASLRWLTENKSYLESIHAIGLVVGFRSYKEIELLEKETHLPLVPANLKQVSRIIGTRHYPVLVYKNWVTQ